MNIDRVGVKQNMSMKAEFLSKVMVVLNIILPFHGICVFPCINFAFLFTFTFFIVLCPYLCCCLKLSLFSSDTSEDGIWLRTAV